MPPEHSLAPEDLRTRLNARFRGPLMSFFQRRIKDRALAQDFTQEVLLRVIEAGGRARIEHPESFVFKVALNLLRDRSRQSARAGDPQFIPIDEALATELEYQLVEELTPERVLLTRDTLADVLQSLNELGERTREIFVLFKLEHMPQQDIAAHFGITRSAVEKHVMKAMLQLGAKYGKR